MPVPYSKPIALVNQPWYSRPDAATCDRISRLRAQYQATGARYSSFSNFLQETMQTTISEEDLVTLESLCNGTLGCRYTTKPIIIPPALQPGTGDGVCVDCNQVNEVYKSFKATFPGTTPTYQQINEYQQQNNQLFKNYMNSKLGFSKTALEYLKFLDTCGIGSGCDSLQALVKRYNMDVNPNRFRSFAQSNLLTQVYHEDLNQITENGALQWPKAIRDTTGRDWVYFQNAVYSPAQFCFQNGYSIEWKFKLLKEVLNPVDDVFYFQDNNVWFVIWKAKTGSKTGLFLGTIKGKSEDNSTRVNLSEESVLLDSDPDAIYKNWNKLKLTVTNTHIKILYNDVLKKEVARTTAPLLNGGAFTLAFLDYQASIDWIKMYDASGNRILFEDYNDPSTRAVVNPSFICPQPTTSCQQSFANYYNQQKSTSYTYQQIDSIYQKTCGQPLEVCGKPLNCDTLLNTLLEYNTGYNPNRANFKMEKSGGTGGVTNPTQIFKNGAATFPQDILQGGKNWYNYFQVARSKAICGGTFYDVEYKFKFPVNDKNSCCFYMGAFSGGAAVFGVRSTGIYFEAFSDEKNYNYGLHHTNADTSLFKTILVEGDLAKLQTWNTVKLRTYQGGYQVYFNDKFVIEIPRDASLPINDTYDETFHFIGTDFSLDWIKISRDNTVAYFEDFNDPYSPAQVAPWAQCSTGPDCKSTFTNFFNRKRDTSYTYEQMDSLYLKTCGRKLKVCPDALTCDALTDLVKRYNKNVNPNRFRSFAQSNLLTQVYHEDLNQITENGALQWPKAIRDTTGRDWVYFQNAVYSPAQFCFQNGYSIEWKFKSLKEVLNPVDDVFYYQDDNVRFSMSRVKTGSSPGIFLNSLEGKSEDNASRVQLLSANVLLDSDPDAIYKNWNKLKLTVTNTHIKIFYNDVLKKEVARTTAPLLNGGAFTLAFLDYQASIDWIKMYDGSGNRTLFEDYNDPSTRAVVNPSFICPQPATSCRQSFTNYYNQQKGTSYTYQQIDSLYSRVCGEILNVCGPSYKDTLKGLVDSFYLKAKPGMPIHDLETQEKEKYYNLADIVHDGVVYFPDSVRQKPSTWYNNYHCSFNAFCTNKGYTVDTKFKFLDFAHYGDVFYLGYGAYTAVFYYEYPGKLYITRETITNNGATESFSDKILIDADSSSIFNWMKFKLVAKPDKYELYYNGRLVVEHARNAAYSFGNAQSFGLGLYGRYGAVDYIRVGDVNDNVKYFEDFNNITRPATVDPSFICAGATDCQLAFKNYYNSKQGTNYSYTQIDSIYSKAGLVLDACDTLTPFKAKLNKIVDSFYVKSKPGAVKHNYAGYKNLPDLVHNGVIYLPDSIRQQPSNWYNNY